MLNLIEAFLISSKFFNKEISIVVQKFYFNTNLYTCNLNWLHGKKIISELNQKINLYFAFIAATDLQRLPMI